MSQGGHDTCDSQASQVGRHHGNAIFGRNNAVGSFVDTHTSTLVGPSCFVTCTASIAASGPQNLDFGSLMIGDAGDNLVATFASHLGTPSNAFYSLNQTMLTPGAYSLIVTAVNSPTQASYTAISPSAPHLFPNLRAWRWCWPDWALQRWSCATAGRADTHARFGSPVGRVTLQANA